MDSFRFSATCRALALAARELGLQAPSFRSPPGVGDATRTIRRRGAAPAVVAVAIHERPAGAVIADLIEGVVVANDLAPSEAVRARSALWESVSDPKAVSAA